MSDRELTGIYVRACREGKWGSVEFTDLTTQQMDSFILKCGEDPTAKGWMFAKALANWIAEHVEEQPCGT